MTSPLDRCRVVPVAPCCDAPHLRFEFHSDESLEAQLQKDAWMTRDYAYSILLGMDRADDAEGWLVQNVLERLSGQDEIPDLYALVQRYRDNAHFIQGLIQVASQLSSEADVQLIQGLARSLAFLQALQISGPYHCRTFLQIKHQVEEWVEQERLHPCVPVECPAIYKWVRGICPKHMPGNACLSLAREMYQEVRTWLWHSYLSGEEDKVFLQVMFQEGIGQRHTLVWFCRRGHSLSLLWQIPNATVFSMGRGIEELFCWECSIQASHLALQLAPLISHQLCSVLRAPGHCQVQHMIFAHIQDTTYIKLDPEFRSLAVCLEESGPLFLTSKLLAIAQSVWQNRSHDPWIQLSSSNIFFAKYAGQIHTQVIDIVSPTVTNASSEMTPFVGDSFAHAWVVWMMTLVSQGSPGESVEGLFRHIERQLDSALSHQIQELYERHSHFGPPFSAALISLAHTMREEGTVDGYSIAVVEELATRTLLYPWLCTLWEKTKNKVLIEPQWIQQGLAEATQALAALKMDLELVSCARIEPNSIQRLAQKLWKQEEAGPKGTMLIQLLQQASCKGFRMGQEQRFHQGTTWQEMVVPISFRLRPFKEGLDLEFFPTAKKVLGIGSYRKVKQGMRAILDRDGQVQMVDSIALSRYQRHCLSEMTQKGQQIHRRILQIPGADAYFVPLPRRHMGYFGGKGIRWEESTPCFDGDLHTAFKLGHIGPQLLTLGDLSPILRHVGEGLALIQQHGICFGDLHSGNILLQAQGDGQPPRPVIADFDFAAMYGDRDRPRAYISWDRMRRVEGIVSETCDRYAWVLLIATTLCSPLRRALHSRSYKHGLAYLEQLRQDPLVYEMELRRKGIMAVTDSMPDAMPIADCVHFMQTNNVAAPAEESGSLVALGEHHKRLLKMVSDAKQAHMPQRAMCLGQFLIESLWMGKVLALLVRMLDADSSSITRSSFPTYSDGFAVLNHCQAVLSALLAESATESVPPGNR